MSTGKKKDAVTGKTDPVTELMKGMGSKKGFDPIPPPQHAWQMEAGEVPLHRVWSWMCAHTIHWGHRSPYAVSKDGDELHLENIAKDLGMDVGNVRHYWREGVRRGIWRNGTKSEGQRRLYLCGEVKPLETPEIDEPDEEEGDNDAPETPGEEEENEVYTNLFPPYISNQISKLSPQMRVSLVAEHVADMKLQNAAIKELVSGVRVIFTVREDSRYQRYGVKKIRESHDAKKGPAEVEQARHGRLKEIMPTLEGFVETLAPVVQTLEAPAAESVQTASGPVYSAKNAETAAASLYAKTSKEEKAPPAGVRSLPHARSSRLEPPGEGEKSPHKQEHTRQTPDSGSAKSKAAKTPTQEKPAGPTAAEILYSGIPELQALYPATAFGKARFTAMGKADRNLVQKILDAMEGEGWNSTTRTVTAEHATEFLAFVRTRFKRGRSPADDRGPKGLGLLVDWGGDWAREFDEPRSMSTTAGAVETYFDRKYREEMASRKKEDSRG